MMFNKENISPNRVGAAPGALKRKQHTSPARASKRVTKVEEDKSESLPVLEVDDQSTLSVEELFKLRFVSGKFDYKARLEERAKYTMFLKERIRGQVTNEEVRQKELEGQAASIKAAIAGLDKRTLELEAELQALDETKASAKKDSEGALVQLTERKMNLSQAEKYLDGKKAAQEASTRDVKNAQRSTVTSQEELSAVQSNLKNMKSTNGGLQKFSAELQEYNTKLQSDLTALHAAKAQIQEEKASVHQLLKLFESDCQVAEGQLETAKAAVQNREACIARLEAEVKTLKSELVSTQAQRGKEEATVEEMQRKVDQYRMTHGKTQTEFDHLFQGHTNLEAVFANQTTTLATMKTELGTTKTRLLMADEASQQKISEFSLLQEALEDSRAKGAVLRKQRLEGEAYRRQLKMNILDLKGNIRVFCRVHPGSDEKSVFAINNDTHEDSLLEITVNDTKHTKYHFGFDELFSPSSTQEEIFDEVAPYVHNAVEGYKVCIISHGREVHESFTMLGGTENEQQGIISSSAAEIFTHIDGLKQLGWNYDVYMSVFQFSEQAIQDIIRPENKVEDFTPEAEDGFAIGTLTRVLLSSAEDADSTMKKTQHRTAAQNLVVQFDMVGSNAATGGESTGTVTLVNLASPVESPEVTGITSLENVVHALSSREKHIPFRNSKLTRFLQPFLGQHSKTIMFANVTPADDVEVSVNTLRFASKVNSCHIGRPLKTRLNK